ncbi:class I SAM-dependent methyltransferase [Streptomyces ossamyceticus]|uniref:Class I SAM-dependent methyltransferase n=1 Tax=Streptomyces ossamyceticus TaxID=249581 RepID=A0ABV2V3N9_9ACTN
MSGVPGPGAPSAEVPEQRETQYAYHRELFPALHDWERTERSIVEFTGETGPSGLLGLDQMGHFGPQGCDLVADAVRDRAVRAAWSAPVAVCELGSGFGGALRYTVDRLASVGVPVRRAFGVELVAEHVAVSRRISERHGFAQVTEVCASATEVPLPGGSLDVVVVTGSMPHFPDPGAVLREAARLLRPGGALALTEEVSLTPASAPPSPEFRRTHPEGVFFTTPLPDRLRQLAEAGLTDVARRDLTPWAVELLAERLKVVRLFRGSVAGIYGEAATDLIRETLLAARAEYRDGRLLPSLITAVRAAAGSDTQDTRCRVP